MVWVNHFDYAKGRHVVAAAEEAMTAPRRSHAYVPLARVGGGRALLKLVVDVSYLSNGSSVWCVQHGPTYLDDGLPV